jgi:hypothetical protein
VRVSTPKKDEMKELIQQRQILKRCVFIYDLVSNVHTWILPMISAILMGLFFDNDFWRATGCAILIYAFAVGMNLISPYCDERSKDLIGEFLQNEDGIKRLEAI